MTTFQLPHSPAAERNQAPILQVLQSLLAPQGTALEVASGTGQHAVHFAAALPGWTWQPSDLTDTHFAAITARADEAGLGRTAVPAPVLLDVLDAVWPHSAAQQPNTAFARPQFDLVYCANMLHIAPWACCTGLMQGAARHLRPGGHLVTYGPYLEHDISTAPGNLAFDATLRQQNPAWGLRHLEDVRAEAATAGLHLAQRHALPANNLLLVWSLAPHHQA